MRLTKPQAQTLRRKWIDGQHEHGSTRGVSYLSFRRTVEPTFGLNDGRNFWLWSIGAACISALRRTGTRTARNPNTHPERLARH